MDLTEAEREAIILAEHESEARIDALTPFERFTIIASAMFACWRTEWLSDTRYLIVATGYSGRRYTGIGKNQETAAEDLLKQISIEL